MDETKQQHNPSAHRSFHAEEYAPAKGPGRTVSKEEAGNPHGRPSRSTGKRGRNRRTLPARPSGIKDASATTGVDPQDPPGTRRA
ncbi:hypothetical protein Snoj_34340 [Streptomyces nojiriensis]|uniref:Uncharacterized protein n=1 Tax=Streptomyces nojiriensis TaxID=66374 RepID=A0ABQ3SMZ8_9ACTN|nr:hypothetical protein GCM10010205_71250 [Streptomyces nojiriensis]GHI69516.1 hypothetical protein Snoj_34340 [Streptomyces nojiriensis]